jgi:DNA (cytosine-5)-methyltransferase 1
VNGLVLSVFPGIDLLGRAFEEEVYTVVRGPDLLWGGDIRGFHPPAGVFEGVIGGPPCQAFSALRHLIRHNGHEPRFGNLIPEYERVVAEVQPAWFLMEEVPDAPVPHVGGYETWECIVRDKWVGGVQPRPRRFSFGTPDGRALDIPWVALMRPEAQDGVSISAGHNSSLPARYGLSTLADGRRVPVRIGGSGRVKRSVGGDARIASSGARVRSKEKGGGALPSMGAVLPIEEACEAMGLPRDFTKEMPFTMHGKRSVIGNGVPMAMGRAVAQAVRRATL